MTLPTQTPVAKWADALTRIKMENPDWDEKTCLLRLTVDAFKTIEVLECRVKDQSNELIQNYQSRRAA